MLRFVHGIGIAAGMSEGFFQVHRGEVACNDERGVKASPEES